MKKLKENKIILYLTPIFGFLILLICMLFTAADNATASQKKTAIDWGKYENKFIEKNVKVFHNTTTTENLYKLQRQDYDVLYYYDPAVVSMGIDHYLYSLQPDPSKSTCLFTVKQANGFYTGMVYKKTGEFVEEFELSGKGENENGSWESYGEFLNDSTYKYTRVVYENNLKTKKTDLVDSITKVRVIGHG